MSRTRRLGVYLVAVSLSLASGLAAAQPAPAPPVAPPAAAPPAAAPAPSAVVSAQGASLSPAAAQGEPADDEVVEEAAVEVLTPAPGAWRPDDRARIERTVNVLGPGTTRPGRMLFVVDHRTWQPFVEDPFYDYLGLDSGGLKIGLGLRFGAVEGLDFGLYRLNNGVEAFDSYDFDARWRVVDQRDLGLDLALRLGATWFVQPEDADAVAPFAQLLVQRQLFDGRLSVGSGLLYHADSTHETKSASDTNWSLALPVTVELRLAPGLAWDAEAVVNLAGYGAARPVLSSALKLITHRHTFSVVVSNTQYMGADGLVANTARGFDELILGFGIGRELP